MVLKMKVESILFTVPIAVSMIAGSGNNTGPPANEK